MLGTLKRYINLDPENFKVEVPEYFNYAIDVVDEWAKQDRNKLALVWTNEEGREKKLSFWDLMIRSNQAANILKGLEISKGDRVMLMLPRIPEWWEIVLGLTKIGAIIVPSTTMLRSRDILYRVKAAEIKAVITTDEHIEKVEKVMPECPSLQVLINIGEPRPNWVNYDEEMKTVSRRWVDLGENGKTMSTDPYIIFFTSGTTGYPKMVLHDHSYPLGHVLTAGLWHDLTPNDLHWTLSDTGWAKAAWGKIYGQWIMGAAVFVYDQRGRFKPAKVLELMDRYGVTTFCAPPTAYRMMILEDLKKYNLSELRHCTSAGEPLNPEVIKVWEQGTGLKIYEGYGQTEAVVLIGTLKNMEVKPGSMGKPMPGMKVEIMDDDGNILGPNEEGNIAVYIGDKYPIGLFKGYWKDEDKNKSVFRNNWYFTGDRAYKDEDGHFWFVGRADDVIKSSGYRIGPFEVESALIEHPAVAEAAVIGVPDPIRGQIVKAFVVLAPGYSPSDALIKELQEHVKNTTAPYKYPRKIEFVSDLPKTISGKIRRVELREREIQKLKKK
ncbi:MAG: AMP-binding protein [Candidatus Desulfofervidaceae bacterium]|nr:AMP-binding protein [Candidatus Desulfofervidaceae bacterium]MDL1969582.1 AMP-binding protein [Candidatus Desulfofervidaceae bacterium]